MATGQFGDPAALVATAAVLAARAETVASVARDIEQRFASIEFEGPAAERVRGELGERRQRADRLADELIELAGAMRQTAVWAEEQQRLAAQQAQLQQQQPGAGGWPQ